MEEWRSTIGYSNYEVSNCGNVRNRNNGHILRPGINTNGYPIVILREQGVSKTRTVHRLVAEAFYGLHPGMVIDHIDGNKENNNLDNLEFCTSGENNRRAYSTGLKRPHACYDMPQNRPVRVIETGKVYKSINECARDIGANHRHISECLNGKLKRHHGYHFEEVLEGDNNAI